MTRQTLTDRQVANLGRTNLLDEDTASAEKYQQSTLNRLFKYQKSNDKRVDEVDKKLVKQPKRPQIFWSLPRKTALSSGMTSCPTKGADHQRRHKSAFRFQHGQHQVG